MNKEKVRVKKSKNQNDVREMCISVQQPWATLLVNGIKKVESRSWTTSHRGRLWIAACKRPATSDDLKLMNQLYGG